MSGYRPGVADDATASEVEREISRRAQRARGPATPLRLLEVRRLDGPSLVLHRYEARTT